MRCTFLGNGVIVCGSSKRLQRCQVSGCHEHSSKQCDFPVKGGTCDRYLCGSHAVRLGPNVDYCPAHARADEDSEAEMRAALGGEG